MLTENEGGENVRGGEMTELKKYPLRVDPRLYNATAAAGKWAARRDKEFFRSRPKAIWRVRPLLDGESDSLTGVLEAEAGRAYAVVIDHRRAKDKRRSVGRAVYPVWVAASMTREEAKARLEEQARILAAHFARTDASPAMGLLP